MRFGLHIVTVGQRYHTARFDAHRACRGLRYDHAVIAQTYDTPPLAYVRSYGCQQNVNDGEKIRGVLMDIGFGVCDSVEQADLILFNTCAVREHAEQRVFGNVGALKKLKEKNPRLIIGVCGCMAQQKHIVDKLRASYPYVDLVFGVDGIDRLPAMLVERLHRGKRYLETPVERNAVVEELPIRRDSGFRAWLPIMYGCDNFCTYCIVPYVRGRERSRDPQAVLAEVRQQVIQILSRAFRTVKIPMPKNSTISWTDSIDAT